MDFIYIFLTCLQKGKEVQTNELHFRRRGFQPMEYTVNAKKT